MSGYEFRIDATATVREYARLFDPAGIEQYECKSLIVPR